MSEDDEDGRPLWRAPWRPPYADDDFEADVIASYLDSNYDVAYDPDAAPDTLRQLAALVGNRGTEAPPGATVWIRGYFNEFAKSRAPFEVRAEELLELFAPDRIKQAELRRLSVLRERQRNIDAELATIVRDLRDHNVTWDEIAAALDLTKQGAHYRYGRP